MAPLLSLTGISKSYSRGRQYVRVLEDVSLEVDPGEFVAIWGGRGQGKTTLLKIAARLETPDSGAVRFDGIDMMGLSEARHARLMLERIGWVRRTGPRSELEMIDYVALPLLARHRRRRAYALAAQALERVGMEECADQRWESLSGGERVLLGIAHGIVRSPQLLLVDDPTANLDVVEREHVTGLLRSLADDEGISVLMAVPDAPASIKAHNIGSLGAGRLSFASKSPVPPRRPDTPGEDGDNVIRLRGRG
ncbi:MAG TPA: ATP-binding cassette domain-containing protein [Solirubrobacteraceae bacterium]|jgi:putative ABC transport system ATP-binding protein|nr:ATP-binding cassette domain-containing protein [Solirubrobacteraceae bacterium]